MNQNQADAGMDYPKTYDFVKDLNPTGLKCLLMKLRSTQGENLVVFISSYLQESLPKLH